MEPNPQPLPQIKWKDLPMKYKLITGGGFSALGIAVIATLFLLSSCANSIHGFQLDALDAAVIEMKKDAEKCLPHDPDYEGKSEEYIQSKVKNRIKKYDDTIALLHAIRNQTNATKGEK